MNTGYIRTKCPECGNILRVRVSFKNYYGPFEDTIHTCSHCGAELLVTDPHEFNEDGLISEEPDEIAMQFLSAKMALERLTELLANDPNAAEILTEMKTRLEIVEVLAGSPVKPDTSPKG